MNEKQIYVETRSNALYVVIMDKEQQEEEAK